MDLVSSRKQRVPYWQVHLLNRFFVIAAIFASLAAINMTYGYVHNQHIEADTTAWLYRAQVANNAQDMADYLHNCEIGMHKWRLTTGYAAFIFKKPDNDMVLIMKSLNTSTKEAIRLIPLYDDPSYAYSMDNLRGVLRELNLCTPYSWWVLHGWVIYVARLMCFTIAIIFLIIWFAGLDAREKKWRDEEYEARRAERHKEG